MVAMVCAGLIVAAPRSSAAPAFPWYSVGAYYQSMRGVATNRYDLNITANAPCPTNGSMRSVVQ